MFLRRRSGHQVRLDEDGDHKDDDDTSSMIQQASAFACFVNEEFSHPNCSLFDSSPHIVCLQSVTKHNDAEAIRHRNRIDGALTV